MKLSIELTLIPLKEDFIPTIKDFIKSLRDSGFNILENPLSTQVYGGYDEVMRTFTVEIKEAFELIESGLLHMKIVKSDRYDYEPHF